MSLQCPPESQRCQRYLNVGVIVVFDPCVRQRPVAIVNTVPQRLAVRVVERRLLGATVDGRGSLAGSPATSESAVTFDAHR